MNSMSFDKISILEFSFLISFIASDALFGMDDYEGFRM
jgi:hypothetical protein